MGIGIGMGIEDRGRVSDVLTLPTFLLCGGGQGHVSLSRDHTGELVWGLGEHGCPVSLVYQVDDAAMRGRRRGNAVGETGVQGYGGQLPPFRQPRR